MKQDLKKDIEDLIAAGVADDLSSEEIAGNVLSAIEVEAVLARSPAKEPAAWQWRYVGATEWSTPSGGKRLDAETLKRERPIEQRPLYASVHPKYILAPAQSDAASEVQDTWLVGGEDLKAMSGSIDSDRVIQLHFKRRATDKDREWLLKAINAQIKADREAASLTPAACEQPDIDALAQFIRDAEREHGQCDDDDTYISYRPTARAILQKFDVRPKHSSTMREGK